MKNDMALQKIKLKIGTVYQKEPNGIYYFRYQVNGARKAISLNPATNSRQSKKQKSMCRLFRLPVLKLLQPMFNMPAIWQPRKRICFFIRLINNSTASSDEVLAQVKAILEK